jgi:hypothetical protein
VDRDWYAVLEWAGDLDRDGKPDALIDLKPEPGRGYALFLSSLASDGEFVKQVATFSTPAC